MKQNKSGMSRGEKCREAQEAQDITKKLHPNHPNHLVETRILGVDRCSVPWQPLSFYNALPVP